VTNGKLLSVCIYSSLFQAFKLCSTGEDGFNLSYELLTSEKAMKALSERMTNNKDFTDTLSRVGPICHDFHHFSSFFYL